MAWLTTLTIVLAGVAQHTSAQPGIVEDDLVKLNGAWFATACETADLLQQTRCDGFIQGVAAVVRARRFGSGCSLEAPAPTIREQVMAYLQRRPSRSPAAQVIWQAIDAAFPCPASTRR